MAFPSTLWHLCCTLHEPLPEFELGYHSMWRYQVGSDCSMDGTPGFCRQIPVILGLRDCGVSFTRHEPSLQAGGSRRIDLIMSYFGHEMTRPSMNDIDLLSALR